jgi:crotonobetainyl-CoA:carnitine CoA-transferase CaiB-like acyl-CoA transferase
LSSSLAGVRVVDASRVLAGPFCAQLLADLGAEVIKVEEPGRGDETRGWGPPFAGPLSAYFLSCNRGKRSVALDLKAPRGRELLLDLTRRADVLLENFRPDSAQKLGLRPQDLHAVNPRLVVASFSGFGRDGALAGRPGYDFVVQGMSGMMAMTGPVDGAPHKFGVAIADIVTGLYAANGILAALHGRQTSGHGYAIEVALIDCAVAAMANVVQSYLTSGQAPRRQGNAHLQIVPYELFATSDGWLVLAVGNDQQWQRFCAVAQRPDLAGDGRFGVNADRVRHRDILVPLVAAAMRGRTSRAWEEALTAAGVPCGPVWDFEQLFASPLAASRGLKLTVKAPDGTPVELVRSPLVRDPESPRCPPQLGEHTAEVLREWLGMRDDEIERLGKEGVFT